MKKKLYIAYGSNMNLPQMETRCPNATVVGVGNLSGYELLFRDVATIEPKEGGDVPVVVWEITENDEAALDRYEGYPNLYRKETVKVRMDKKTVDAMVYIMNVNAGRPLRLPSKYYYDVICEGYKSAGIPLDVLKQALAASHA